MTSRNAFGFDHHFEPAVGGSEASLLLLHGTGGDESQLIDIGRQIAPGAALLSPRGKVREHGAPRFFRRLAEGVFDLEDLKFRANELAEFILGSCEAYQLNPDKMCAVGYSNGANIAGAVLLLRPEVLHHAALLRPMVPLQPDVPPDLRGHRVLIAAGRADPLVSPSQTAELVQLLTQFGVDVTQTTANAGHQLTPSDLESIARWLSAAGGILEKDEPRTERYTAK